MSTKAHILYFYLYYFIKLYSNFLFFNLCYNINIKDKIDFKIQYLDITKKGCQMRKDTKNFINFTEYDLKTAEFMLNSERYIYVIFMCHLAKSLLRLII